MYDEGIHMLWISDKMTEQISASTAIRPDMVCTVVAVNIKELRLTFEVGIAVGFLQNPQVTNEPMDRKRAFLQKKGGNHLRILSSNSYICCRFDRYGNQ
jgi:hypothetical protein